MRRLACFSLMPGPLRREVDVAVLRRVGVDQAVLLGGLGLDTRRGERARELRLQGRILSVQLHALGVRRVEGEVEPQDRHVHEYDAREQNPADRDPEDAAPGAGTTPGARARAGLPDAGQRLGDGTRPRMSDASQPSSPPSGERTARAGSGRSPPPTDGSPGAVSPVTSALSRRRTSGSRAGRCNRAPAPAGTA